MLTVYLLSNLLVDVYYKNMQKINNVFIDTSPQNYNIDNKRDIYYIINTSCFVDR